MNISRTQAFRHPYALGIDVGSTTVKAVILDQNHQMVYSNYQRHFSKVKETIIAQLRQIAGVYPDIAFPVCITGSAGLGLADSAKLPFVQEVHAAFVAVNQRFPDADAVIELGGEDAKIIFLTGGVEQRMNGSCAGGTGAFIDQMATLLNVTADQLDEMSLRAEKTYPIASRCGVFAKSDIQPLLNQGARREDIAASIFQAVVDQTVSGLAQGRTIEGKVLFLGGPLSFLEGLRHAFVKTLNLDPGNAVFPEDGRTFVAYGCALSAMKQNEAFPLEALIQKISNAVSDNNVLADPPLFSYPEEYERFRTRHASHDVARGDFRTYEGKAYLGIDAGSTTTKMVVISEDRTLLYEYYTTNKGQPLDCITEALNDFYSQKSPYLTICGSAVTGYGEELLKAGLMLDHGIVETVAHFKAASFFCPEVDFIMDIGGQDIKCFKIKNGAIDSIMLNEACSSGCGSFIQTFAMALGYDIAEFANLGLFAERPVDLGSRCTVFMNSSVKQAQKDGATVADISAGLSGSIIKNAVYKVIRANSPEDLGQHIVVQGGTFLNDAVLRAFEREMGRDVIRPAISGLMGAFGAALYAQEKSDGTSTIIDKRGLKDFSYTSQAASCKGCTARCSLNVVRFANGGRYVSGNRCERGAGMQQKDILPNLYDRKLNLILSYDKNLQPVNPIATVGLPLALHYYDQMPLWATFFKKLNFQVVFSEISTRETYYKGQSTIPSDTVCYPAKLTHGHIECLLKKDVDFIFYPCMSYTLDEGESDNHFNCPVVAYYPELLMANNEALSCKNFLYPFLDLNRRKHVIHVLHEYFGAYATKKEIAAALEEGFEALESHRALIATEAQDIIQKARKVGKPIIVLAGRPYHIDPEINHGIHKLIASLGMAVITEDSVAALAHTPKLNSLNQWVYHSRLYRAAEYVTTQPDMQLIQLVSFGCGIDAITTDEVRRILEEKGKLYTQLKIDEINNLGAAKIRLRSLVAAMDS